MCSPEYCPYLRVIYYSEGKQYMLATVKRRADFSRGCAGKTIGHLILKTHPPPIRIL